MAYGTLVTATVGNGGLTPSVLGAVEEWLAFNASVRRAGEPKGRLSFTLTGGLERDVDDSPCSRVGSLPSSEAEMFCPLEGRFATLERGGDAGHSRGSRWEPSSETEITPRVQGGCGWAACWASLSPFLSSRLEGGRRPSWAQLPNMCLRFQGDFSTPVRVPLIVVPDSSPRGFGRVRGFGQRVFRRFYPLT